VIAINAMSFLVVSIDFSFCIFDIGVSDEGAFWRP
jgi:hypothetical protein